MYLVHIHAKKHEKCENLELGFWVCCGYTQSIADILTLKKQNSENSEPPDSSKTVKTVMSWCFIPSLPTVSMSCITKECD